MANKLNGWTRWVIFAAGALVALGGYLVTVRSNTIRIADVEIKSHTNEGDIRDLKKDITYIKEGIGRIETAVNKE